MVGLTTNYGANSTGSSTTSTISKGSQTGKNSRKFNPVKKISSRINDPYKGIRTQKGVLPSIARFVFGEQRHESFETFAARHKPKQSPFFR